MGGGDGNYDSIYRNQSFTSFQYHNVNDVYGWWGIPFFSFKQLCCTTVVDAHSTQIFATLIYHIYHVNDLFPMWFLYFHFHFISSIICNRFGSIHLILFRIYWRYIRWVCLYLFVLTEIIWAKINIMLCNTFWNDFIEPKK